MIHAQVRSTLLGDMEIREFIPLHLAQSSPAIELPPPNIRAALEEDAANGSTLPRFGVKIPTALSFDEGSLYEQDGKQVWKLTISSPGATSLGFEFVDMYLPENSELYLYSENPRMVVGPVRPENIHEGIFSSDHLRGDRVVMELHLPEQATEQVRWTIRNVVYGFKDISSQRAYGDAAPCNEDINCPSGNGWERERDAVGMVLVNNEAHCSGALVNTACQDLSSFFLTAFHCLDGNGDGTLSNKEKNAVANWTFRFNYDSPACNGPEPTSWITYSGAAFRSAWRQTDFALLELNGSLANQSSLALAGWNREENPWPMNQVVCIHHPAGDVKKISVDNEIPTEEVYQNFFLYWYVEDWDVGTTEGGSSGSPLFDENHRIIGQNHRGDGEPICGGDKGTRFGQFNESWTGGGANDSRLSTWLGGGGNPLTTNTVRIPQITSGYYVCTSNTSHTLQNAASFGLPVSWQASPAGLFATASGTGATAVLRAASSSSAGAAALTFTINTGAGGDNLVFSKSLWVGKPGMPTTNPSGTPTINLGLGALLSVYLTSPNGSYTASNWWSGGSLTTQTTTSQSAVFEGSSLGSGNFYVTTSNVCGTSPTGGGAVNVTLGGGGMYRIAPNPVRDELTVSLHEGAERASQLILRDLYGKAHIRIDKPDRQTSFSVAHLQAGVYTLEWIAGQQRQTHKVMIIR